MAKTIVQYRVFIASPGGLDKEREAFRTALSSFNEMDGNPRGIQFIPVGWEATLRGVGRPQEKINAEVESSDFFLLLLWDRWGTPPDTGDRFSSGTEEEYNVALTCYRSRSRPMREIVVLFKAVDPRQLSDPGPQLAKVLEFKKQLEAGKKIFFDTFDDIPAFTNKLRQYLAHWTREHEGSAKSQVSIERFASEDLFAEEELFSRIGDRTSRNDGGDYLRGVRELLNAGKLTEAESRLVKAIMPGDDMRAFRAYATFLVRGHRLTDAESVYNQMLRIAKDAEEYSWAATALAGLGGVYRVKKDYIKAKASLIDALALKEKAGDEEGAAHVAIWLGDLYSEWQKWAKAAEFYHKGLRLFGVSEVTPTLASVLEKLAKVSLSAGKTVDAIQFEKRAREVYTTLDDVAALNGLKSWYTQSLQPHLSKKLAPRRS